jgi:ABC-type sugar transport system permease subunit
VTADFVFQIANGVALITWVALGCAIVFRREGLMRWIGFVPIALSALYALLILLFFFKAEGGFDSLANVQRLFISPWAALAGWVHYLAFDLLIGTWIARETTRLALPRWPLIALLPLTFMFGPAGFLGFEITKFLFAKDNAS